MLAADQFPEILTEKMSVHPQRRDCDAYVPFKLIIKLRSHSGFIPFAIVVPDRSTVDLPAFMAE